ncbi:hypothetical protein [Bacillus toyonensis]|uniref:hypothetical protein n=1 Tax=Bacillus toyonensis TaxID=155322 RepID=UPI000BF21FE7|nr:hypothetical protein [Bacillus toyonensis]PEM43177.1 hypothetical protein CN636_17135 [Bacillus toyonensis]
MDNEKLLAKFHPFFNDYLETWNKCDLEELALLFSKDMLTSNVYPNNRLYTGGYNEAVEGWKDSYEYFKGQNPKWHFKILHVTRVDVDKVTAVFFVTHSTNGEMSDKLCFYWETFILVEGYWKLVRTYSESAIPTKFVSK